MRRGRGGVDSKVLTRGVIVDVRALVVVFQKHDRAVDGHGPRAALEPDDVVLKRIGRVRHGRRLMHLRPAVLERDRARARSELELVTRGPVVRRFRRRVRVNLDGPTLRRGVQIEIHHPRVWELDPARDAPTRVSREHVVSIGRVASRPAPERERGIVEIRALVIPNEDAVLFDDVSRHVDARDSDDIELAHA